MCTTGRASATLARPVVHIDVPTMTVSY